MDIIPVIDLLDGQVVHAQRGERQHYQSLRSSLCHSSGPLAVVSALLELYPFEQLYIADLNAIQKRGNHASIITGIISAYPHLNIWLDCGISCIEDLTHWQNLNVNFVIGSESLKDMVAYSRLQAAGNHILSLDFSLQGYMGPLELLDEAQLWPERIIAMTLGVVGSAAGPDMVKLHEVRSRSYKRKIYGAGGVRHLEDLLALKKIGIDGVLIATALHSGDISADDIACIV